MAQEQKAAVERMMAERARQDAGIFRPAATTTELGASTEQNSEKGRPEGPVAAEKEEDYPTYSLSDAK